MYILTIPCVYHISVWNRFYFATDRIADLITVKAMRQKNSIIMLYNSLGQLN